MFINFYKLTENKEGASRAKYQCWQGQNQKPSSKYSVSLFEPEIWNFLRRMGNITFPPPLSPPSCWDQKTILLPLCKHCAICTAPFVEAKSSSSSVSSLRCMIQPVLLEIWCGRRSFLTYEAKKMETGPLCSVSVETASHKGENQDHS